MITRHMFQTGALRGATVLLGALLAMSVAVQAADPSTFPAPTGDTSFVPSGAKLELIFDGGCALTEGVAAGHDGMIYFSDITFTKFCKDPSGKVIGHTGHQVTQPVFLNVHKWHARQHGPGIHTHQVRMRQEFPNLSNGQPPEPRLHWQFMIRGNHDVAISLVKESGTLLQLQLIDSDTRLIVLEEVVEVCRPCPTVDLCVVASCCLNRGRQLDTERISGLHLRLH